MSIHRYWAIVAITITLFGLGAVRVDAQARVDSGEVEDAYGREPDADGGPARGR